MDAVKIILNTSSPKCSVTENDLNVFICRRWLYGDKLLEGKHVKGRYTYLCLHTLNIALLLSVKLDSYITQALIT